MFNRLSSNLELSTYYPVDSRVKPLRLSNFERQVLFLLSTPPVYRMMNAERKTENGKADMKLQNEEQIRITAENARQRRHGFTNCHKSHVKSQSCKSAP